MIQGGDEWFSARIGKVTASKISDVMATIKSGEAAARRNYKMQLVVERLTGERTNGYSNAAMEWGLLQEPFARQAYEFETGSTVDQVGFIDHPTIPMAGASPDGLVGVDGMIEIKCPNTANHVEWLLSGEIPSQHIQQMQWQMACTGRVWNDFISYDPMMPLHRQLYIKRLLRDDAAIEKMEESAKVFLSEVDELVRRLA